MLARFPKIFNFGLPFNLRAAIIWQNSERPGNGVKTTKWILVNLQLLFEHALFCSRIHLNILGWNPIPAGGRGLFSPHPFGLSFFSHLAQLWSFRHRQFWWASGKVGSWNFLWYFWIRTNSYQNSAMNPGICSPKIIILKIFFRTAPINMSPRN